MCLEGDNTYDLRVLNELVSKMAAVEVIGQAGSCDGRRFDTATRGDGLEE
jgi:hypothetical protein